MSEIKLQKIVGHLLHNKLRKLYLNGTVMRNFIIGNICFSEHTIRSPRSSRLEVVGARKKGRARGSLLRRLDRLQKTLVRCPCVLLFDISE